MIRMNSLIQWLMVVLFIPVLMTAQSNLEKQLTTVENELSKARQDKVDLISPENFKEAEKNFEDAKKALQKGKSPGDVYDKLEKAARALKNARDVALKGSDVFKAVLEARDDALSAGATEYAAEEFLRSEKILYEAARKLEKGDDRDAAKKAAEAEVEYRKAELKAIKESIVGPVRAMLDEARKQKVQELAPLTIQRAEELYQQVIALLTSNRYDRTNALQLAEEAEYEVKHALFLADTIKKLKKDEQNWEILIRDFEDRFNHVANQLGFTGRYDQGFSKTENEIVLAIQNLQEENRTLKEDLKNLQQERDSLLARIQQYEKTVVSELEKKKEWEAKLKKVEKNFTPDEAQVLLSENKIIIRLYGLTFQSGKAVIQPNHFMLLTKVMRSLRLFPNNKIIVAGHTDSQGNDAFNQRLSEERAAAVKKYLEANMGLTSDQIVSIGYGETRPIANNETPEGRRLNRRIEVIVDLESEISPTSAVETPEN